MISMLKNNINRTTSTVESAQDQADEANLIHLIYRFAGKKDEWFNLLLSLSKCIAINQSLPSGHPYQGMSERLLAHLKNAIKISGRLNSGPYTLLNNNVLDRLPVPAGIMDSRGRLVEINQLALNKIDKLPQWSIQHQILHLDHIDIHSEIQALLKSGDSFRSFPAYFEDALANTERLPYRDRDRVFLSQIPNPATPEKPYFYFCFDQSRAKLVSTELLRQEYQLTETEALVVLTLLEEVSSARVAKKLKLKEATLRGHLSSIYQKTGVSRKPELIRKVMLHCLGQATHNTTFFDLKENKEQKLLLANDRKHSQLKSLQLSDGRNLSYLDICYQGAHETKETILVLHNLMGSAFELPPSAYSLLKEKKIRVLVPERPGYGNSDRCPNRSHQGWCRDVTELLDDTGIDKVKVIAHSIGGAYALAMAEFMPERVERISMVNAITRLDDMLQSKPVPVLINAIHQSLRFAPFLIEPILKMAVGRDIEQFYTQQLNYMRPSREGRAADINLLSQPEYRHYSINNIKQSARQGVQIWAEELKLSFADWPFEVRNKQIEYQFWHGDEDDVIAINAAIRLAKELNTQRFYRLKYETHFLFSRHIHEVIEQLISPETELSSPQFQAMTI